MRHKGIATLLASFLACQPSTVREPAPPLPEYYAPRLPTPPSIDGRITDAEWRGVPWIDGFTLSSGRGPSRLRTRARLAWDDAHLYVAFAAEDPDIRATYSARDAPIYREEALELFIDPTGGGRDYIELEVSPRNVQFDAAFSGGPRRNMRTAFDARFVSAVELDGDLRMPGGDRGWQSEWAIEVASLPGAAARLASGDRWRVNLFRIAKDAGAQGGVRADESAWSPPLMGDFHNLERFGTLWFVDARRSEEAGARAE